MNLARLYRLICGALLVALATSCTPDSVRVGSERDTVVISVVGTNDIHGQFLPNEDRGGVTTLSGYVDALRRARNEDGGVLLVDGGDMWQGTLESNLNEGALMVQAFNALGYSAAAIGNHEFDFGPSGAPPIPRTPSDDPRGNLKQRASEAAFPLLAANLIDTATDTLVDWNNVKPSILVDVAGIKIGVIGILTSSTIVTTISANVDGLRISPLTDAIVREATRLREAGASLVVVTAHAGGRCEDYSDPYDLSSCDLSREILSVANSLPEGLVDHINGGHEAHAIAHVVNGTAVTAGTSYTRSFSRVDFTIDRDSGSVLEMQVFPPQRPCPMVDPGSGSCVWTADNSSVPATYEGYPVVPDPAIVAIARAAAARAAELKLEELGVTLESRFSRDVSPESPLANLVLDALYESLDTDVALLNVSGGLRTDLPAGQLTYGSVFEMFPFDNLVVILDLSGADLRKIIAVQALNRYRRAAFSGMRVFVACEKDRLNVAMKLNDNRDIRDDDRVRVAINDFLAMGGDDLMAPVTPPGGFDYEEDPRLVRDVIADWLRQRGGSLHVSEFDSTDSRRWNLPEPLPPTCTL